jgi:hypothetical protein
MIQGTLDFNATLTEEQRQALDILMDKSNPFIFLTGEAGTAYHQVMDTYLEKTTERVVKLAPTHNQAVAVGGESIGSFFKFPHTSQKHGHHKPIADRWLDAFDTIVIYNIETLRSDIMNLLYFSLLVSTDGVEWGGKRIICTGDLSQNQPYVPYRDKNILQATAAMGGPWFFQGLAQMKTEVRTVCLEENVLFTDLRYHHLLQEVRKGGVTTDVRVNLNDCVETDWSERPIITLFPDKAENINNHRVANMPGQVMVFHSRAHGNLAMHTNIPHEIRLKKNVPVMFTQNDPEGRFTEGETGTVLGRMERGVVIETGTGVVELEPLTTTKYRYLYDAATEGLYQNPIGEVSQLPVLPAFALGLNQLPQIPLDAGHIDWGRGCFAHGQLYRFLSSVKGFHGLTLEKGVHQDDNCFDKRIIPYL